MARNAYPTRQPQEAVLRQGTWQAEQPDRFGTGVSIAQLAVPSELDEIIAEGTITPAANPMRYQS